MQTGAKHVVATRKEKKLCDYLARFEYAKEDSRWTIWKNVYSTCNCNPEQKQDSIRDTLSERYLRLRT